MNPLSQPSSGSTVAQGVTEFHGVRYLVTDVKQAIDFYTMRLGLTLEYQQIALAGCARSCESLGDI